MKGRKLLVLSLDALNTKDFELIKDLPNFSKFLQKGSYGKFLKGVYPSHTYTTHASVITGLYPDKHGIISNYIPSPGVLKPDWYWQYHYFKSPTLLDLAKNHGLKTATFLWPVTAKGPQNINFPEIWDPQGKKSQIRLSLSHGSPLFLLRIRQKYGDLLRGKEHPELDDFTTRSVLDLLSRKPIDIAFIHLADLDTHRHYHGTFDEESLKALPRLDHRLGQIFTHLREKGEWESTDIVAFGDHGFLDIAYQIHINHLFLSQKWLEFDENQELLNWKVWGNSCEGSCHVYLKDHSDEPFKETVYNYLSQLQEDPRYGIERIYTREDFKELHTGGDASFILEARKGFAFTHDWSAPAIEPVIKNPENKTTIACHGYSPDKPDYSSLFLAMGPSFKEGGVLEEVRIIDIAPTLAKIQGLDLSSSDGRVLEEILTDS